MQPQDFDVIEAYPAAEVDSDADKFHGSLSMFLSAGFHIHKEAAPKDASVVRKKLR